MTTNAFKLGLPTDIPWTRICVTEDMLDRDICDKEMPPKWHSSIAVFRYTPPAEQQEYPDYDVSYLKVAVSITGYQPKDREIEGTLDWGKMTTETIEEVEDLLNEYQPCTGAIVQIEVAPKDRQIELDRYPYFLDFEPKKRELFELASDTREKMSRSLHTLGVGKSGTRTNSLEVLDIDMGGSFNVGAQGSYAGTGGGLTIGGSSAGQWGTKDVSSNQSGTLVSADASAERRETQSYTTQISQLYHLLDAYHLGTNRALFLIEPRPHVLAEASGFVRGPRPIDGIQEFFLIVATPKDQDFCTSVRLDTAHLADLEILDYATRKDAISLSVSASPPAREDAEAVFDGYDYMGVDFIVHLGERRYACYQKRVEDTEAYIAANRYPDYKIDTAHPYDIVAQSASRGGNNVTVTADGEALTATVWATSRKCYDDGGTVCADCPSTWHAASGNSSLELTVNLISREKIVPVGKEKVLLVTTRGLCCCADRKPSGHGVLDVRPLGILVRRKADGYGINPAVVERWLGSVRTASRASAAGTTFDAAAASRGAHGGATDPDPRGDELTVRDANALSKLIVDELRSRAMSETRQEPVPYVLHDFFLQRLTNRLYRYSTARKRLAKPIAADHLPEPKALMKYFGREEITARDLAGVTSGELARITKVDAGDIARARLGGLGIAFRSSGKTERGGKGK